MSEYASSDIDSGSGNFTDDFSYSEDSSRNSLYTTNSDITIVQDDVPAFLQTPIFGDILLHSFCLQLANHPIIIAPFSFVDALGWYFSVVKKINFKNNVEGCENFPIREKCASFLQDHLGPDYDVQIAAAINHYNHAQFDGKIAFFQVILNAAVARVLIQLRSVPLGDFDSHSVITKVRYLTTYAMRPVDYDIGLEFLPVGDGGFDFVAWTNSIETYIMFAVASLERYVHVRATFRRDYWIRRRIDEFRNYVASKNFSAAHRLTNIFNALNNPTTLHEQLPVEPQSGESALGGLLNLFRAASNPRSAALQVDEALETLKAINPDVRRAFGLMETAEQATTRLGELVSLTKVAAPILIPIICGVSLYALRHSNHPALKAFLAVLMGSSMLYGATSDALTPLWDLVIPALANSSGTSDSQVPIVHDLAEAPIDAQAEAIADIASAIATTVSLYNGYGTNMVKIMQLLASVGTASRSIETILTLIFDTVIRVIGLFSPYYARVIGGQALGITATEWYTATSDLLAEAEKDELVICHSTYDRITLLIHDGKKMLTDAEKSKKNIGNATLNGMIHQLEKMRASIAPKISQRGSLRIRPVAALFTGASGVGKSNWSISLARKLIEDHLREGGAATAKDLATYLNDDSQYIWFKSPDKFSDGLGHKTLAIIWDDWGQVNTSKVAADSSPGMELIQLCSDQKYTPRMANVELKNMISASNRYVILTSNEDGVHDNTIKHHEALGRRFDFIYQTLNKPGCKKGIKLDTSIYEFKPLDYNVGSHKFEPKGHECGVHAPDMVCALIRSKFDANEAYFKNSGVSWALDTDQSEKTLREMVRSKGVTPDKYVETLLNIQRQYDARRLAKEASEKLVSQDGDDTKELPPTPPIPIDTPDEVVEMLSERWGAREYFESIRSSFPSMPHNLAIRLTDAFDPAMIPSRWKFNWTEFKQSVGDSFAVGVQAFRDSVHSVFFNPVVRALKRVGDFFSSFLVKGVAVAGIAWLLSSIVPGLVTGGLSACFQSRQPVVNYNVAPPVVNVNVSNYEGDQYHEAPFVVNSSGSRRTADANSIPGRHAGMERYHPDLYSGLLDPMLDQASGGGVGKVPGAPKSRRTRGKPRGKTLGDRRRPTPVTQGAHGPLSDGVLAIREKISKNMFHVTIRNARRADIDSVRRVESPLMGWAVGLRNGLIVMPEHFRMYVQDYAYHYGELNDWTDDQIEDYYEDTELEFTRAGVSYVRRVGDFEFFAQSVEHDVAYGIVPLNWGISTIINHFISQRELSSLTLGNRYSFGGVLFGPGRDYVFQTGGAISITGVKVRSKTVDQFGNRVFSDEMESRENVVCYPLTTRGGDCGMLLTARTDGYDRVIGLHAAGNNVDHGYACVLTKEDILKAVGENKEVVLGGLDMDKFKLECDFKDLAPDAQDFHGDLDVDYYTRHQSPRANVKMTTNIVPWDGDGPLPYARTTVVSNISPTQFAKNHGGSDGGPWSVDDRILRAVKAHLVGLIRSNAPMCLKMVPLTLKEVMLGVKGTYIDPMNAKKSPGYPDGANSIRRSDYFRYDGDEFTFGPRWSELITQINETLFMFSRGFPRTFPWFILQKGERQTRAKYESGRTRWISCGALSFQIIMMMYYGAAIDMIKRGRIRNGFLTGVNERDADQWTSIVNYLAEVGGAKYCGSADFTQFDKNTKKECVEHCFDVLDSLYPDATTIDQRIRHCIRANVAESVQVYGSVVEVFHSMMPSGCRLTYELNCLQNLMIDLYTWVQVHAGDTTSLSTFSKHVRPLVCGDDKLFSVSDSYHSVYNEAAIAQSAALFGQKMTNADKGPCGTELTPLINHTVLKRGFRYERLLGKWVAPLKMATVLEVPLWTRAKAERVEIAQSNMKFAVCEASLHGKAVFDDLIPQWRRFSGRYWDPTLEDWETVFRLVTEQGLIGYSQDGEQFDSEG